MFIKQLHDFDFRPRHDTRLARVNVELEQSARTIDVWKTDCKVHRSVAVVVDCVLIDAVQRTQQLARAFFAVYKCHMQRSPTFVLKKKWFRSQNQRTFSKIILRNNWPAFVSLISSRAPSNQREQRIGVPSASCYMYCLPTFKSTRGEIEVNW